MKCPNCGHAESRHFEDPAWATKEGLNACSVCYRNGDYVCPGFDEKEGKPRGER